MILDSNPLTVLLKPAMETDSWLWGTVTSVTPLLVKLDGETQPLPIPLELLTSVKIGDRVRVHLHQRRALIIGKTPPPDDPTIGVWNDLPLSSPWGGVSGRAKAGYLKTRDGLVMLRGAVNGGAVNSIIGTLPAGYRPPYPFTVPVSTSYTGSDLNSLARLEILVNGQIKIGPKYTGFVGLDGVYFHTI